MTAVWHAALLLFAAAIAGADTMRFEPPDPTPHTPVDVFVSGCWLDNCVPVGSDVSINASTITLRMVRNETGCVAGRTAYGDTVHLGMLPAGKYTVIATLASPAHEIARNTLVVRDVDTFRITPYAIPTSGARITIDVSQPTNITIDGVPAPFSSSSVSAPPHAPGAVDVAVTDGTTTRIAKAAIIYYDPQDADPILFEPILFPVAFEGPGALGSRWTTENSIWVGATAFRDPIVTGRLPNTNQPWGQVLYARRAAAIVGRSLTLFSSRVREVSRQPNNTGTEVPIVRERDFRGERLWFWNAPVGVNLRAMLRVWSLDPVDDITYSASLNPIAVPMAKVPGTSLYFGSADITKQTGNLVEVGSETSLPRIWAMIAYTDNDTQQVTIVTPHQQ